MKLRNVFSVLLVLCIVVTLLPLSASAETIIASGLHDGGPVKWKITSDGTLTIEGNRSIQGRTEYDWWDYADIITKVIVEDGLKTIPEKAFWNMQNITEVYIGNTVTAIHEKAFSGCCSLVSVHIPANVATLGEFVFRGCTSLATVTYDADSKLTTIPKRAFIDSGLTYVNLPSSVTCIDDQAFYNCDNLTYINLTEGLKIIENEAFAYCDNVTGLSLPSTVTTIRYDAFDQTHNITHLDLHINLSFERYFPYNDSLTSVVFHDGMTVASGFDGCTTLTDVTFADSIEVIGSTAFWRCTSFTEIAWPKKLKTIGSFAFGHTLFTDIRLPDTVTAMHNSAFTGCPELVSFAAGEQLEAIANGNFYGCPKLTSVDMRNITSIGFEAFYDCTSLSDITWSENLETIGYLAFKGCTALTSVTFPASLAEIEHSAFYDCTNLSQIVFTGDAPTIHHYVFDGVTAIALYPADNPTWTEEVMQDYGGHITWVPDNHPHEYESVVTAPTCTESGCTTHTCTVCGDTYISDEIPALGHTFEDGYCTVCGASERAMGDVNNDGEIDIFDANLIVACYNGTTDLDADQQKAADVNGDGEVDIFDANLVVAFYNGTLSAFPLT